MEKKISIITVVFNGEKFIEKTIKSVLSQTYQNIEYIIIDGGSTDGTVDIIKKYGSKIDLWKSEKDNGIYDAMNKGISLATGEVISLINSDDYYYRNKTIETIMSIFNNDKVDICYGDCIQVSRNDETKVIRYWKSKDLTYKNYHYGWYPPHPSFFVTKKMYEKYGTFDTNIKIASDVDLMLRFLNIKSTNDIYSPNILVSVRAGGLSNKNFTNTMKLNLEIWKSLKKYNLNKSVFHYILGKLLSRILQFYNAKYINEIK